MLLLPVCKVLTACSFRDDVFALGEARVGYYVGTELAAEDGRSLGMLCVADVRPLHCDGSAHTIMASMAQLVARELAASALPPPPHAPAARAPCRPQGACTPSASMPRPRTSRSVPSPIPETKPNPNPNPTNQPSRPVAVSSARSLPAAGHGALRGAANANPLLLVAGTEEARMLVNARKPGWSVLHANSLAKRDLRACPSWLCCEEDVL